jgi:peptidyl-prolyl cis-trans isomerase SurA
MPLSTHVTRGIDHRLPMLGVLTVASVLAACGSKPATPPAPAPVSPTTWAVVNGRTISRDDVEKAFRRMQDPSETPGEEEALAAKLNLLNDLIVQDLLLERARALKLEVPASELDAAYAKRKENLPDDAYQQELKRRNLTAEDMREGLKRDLLLQKVIEKEIGSKVAVSDQMVTEFFDANRSQFNLQEEAYHLAQIVITPMREERLANGTGDDATTPAAAAAKVRMLMERLKSGTSFRDLAVGYSEDAESAPRGGDLGLVPMSRLKQAPPQLRNAVLNKTPGTVNVASAGNGAYTLVLVVAHEQAGQRDLSTPGVRDRITETLKGRREQLLRLAYLTALRNDAQVVNHLARQLTEASGALPPPPAPLAPPK